MRNIKVATMPPPTSPTKSEMIVRKKSINTVEITLGVTNFFVGSVPKARMASICSVTNIEPISLAIREEFRHHANRDQLPDETERPESLERMRAVQRQHGAGERAREHHDRKRTHADQIGLLDHVGKVAWMAKEIGERSAGEQGIILHGLNDIFREVGGRSQFHERRALRKYSREVCKDQCSRAATSLTWQGRLDIRIGK